jgi:translation elongation factor EF-Tu-like GTPase
MNGTGREMLTEDYTTAYHKLIEFRDSFRSIEFNARDYYVQSSSAFSAARTERDIMEHKIGSLMQYLEAHLVHLSE